MSDGIRSSGVSRRSCSDTGKSPIRFPGVALEALGLGLNPSLRTAASLILILAGIATPVQAWIGWYQTERALREARPLPSPFLAAPIGLVVVVVGVLVALAILIP